MSDNKYFTNITRPNLHNLTEKQLLEIISQREQFWIHSFGQNHNQSQPSRNNMVDKIFSLWSQENLSDTNGDSIGCLICWDPLTNGNNLTLECGHKFHSMCLIKSVMISSVDKYIEFSNDSDKSKVDIQYNCPQCKNLIETCSYEKEINNNNNNNNNNA